MKIFRIPVVAYLAITAWLASAVGHGNLVYIEYRDINPPTSSFPDAGGPHWFGFVDTIANTLTIEQWNEIPGSVQFWTPLWTPDLSAFPLVWPAVDSLGNEYDVPNSFDGANDDTFAFISTVSARNMVWNEGTFSLPAVADFYPGWGGVRRPVPGQNPVVLFYDTSADEHSMPLLPSSAFGVSESTLATVTVTIVPSSPESIPEVSAWAMGLAASSAAAWGALRRRALLDRRKGLA